MNLKRLQADGILAEYGRVFPGEGFSRTRGSAIGVAFTPQQQARWSVGATQLNGRIEPASVLITPADGIDWWSWNLVSESIEIWLDETNLSQWSHAHGGPTRVLFDLRDRVQDPIIVNLAARVRRLLCAQHPSPEALAALGQELGEHFFRGYVGVRVAFAERPLEARRLKRVLDYMDAYMNQPLRLERLAEVAATSPFHFARSFKIATGSPPHVFMVARRMDRAAALLRATPLTVPCVAEAVGFASLPHFRKHFRAHWGISPGEFANMRAIPARTGPSAVPSSHQIVAANSTFGTT